MMMFFKNIFSLEQPEKKDEPESASLKNANQLQVNQLFNNRYQIEKALSDSSYLAVDLKRERRKVVVKHIYFKTSKKVYFDKVSDFFALETARLVKLADSCNLIPKLLDYIKDSHNFYLVSEYIEGKTIAEEFANSKPSELVIAKLLKEVLTELQVFHDLNIIHKNIEANHIIRRTSDLKFIFIYYGGIDEKCLNTSINELFDGIPEGTLVNVYFGYPNAWAPELRAGRPQFASDIYAVGLMGMQLLVDMSLYDISNNPATGEYLWRKYCHVSDRFANILNKMIDDRTRHRYKIIAEVLEDIDLFMGSEIDKH